MQAQVAKRDAGSSQGNVLDSITGDDKLGLFSVVKEKLNEIDRHLSEYEKFLGMNVSYSFELDLKGKPDAKPEVEGGGYSKEWEYEICWGQPRGEDRYRLFLRTVAVQKSEDGYSFESWIRDEIVEGASIATRVFVYQWLDVFHSELQRKTVSIRNSIGRGSVPF